MMATALDIPIRLDEDIPDNTKCHKEIIEIMDAHAKAIIKPPNTRGPAI